MNTKSKLVRSLLAFALFAASPVWAQTAAPAAPAAAPSMFAVSPKDSSLKIQIVHKLHKVDGSSSQVSGKARILPSGQAQVQVSVKADSFDTANVNRDATVKEVVEASKFPTIELKAGADGLTLPASFPATVEKTFKANVNFHGVQQTVDIPVKVTFESASRIRAEADFKLSLDSFKVERPSLFLVKIDDALVVKATLLFNQLGGPG